MVNFKEDEQLKTLNHSCAHLMAQAIKHLYPQAKFWVGPVVAEGFYYDVDLGDDVIRGEEDLAAIEKEMKKVAKSGKKIIRKEISKEEALEIRESVCVSAICSQSLQKTGLLSFPHTSCRTWNISQTRAIMKEGKIIENDTTEQLVRLVDGKIWECKIPSSDLVKWERALKLINLRNEADGTTSIRYLSDKAETPDSVPAVPRLEDLYLWLFPQEGEVRL